MTELQIKIQALSDAEAVALLRRFVRALGNAVPTHETIEECARVLIDRLSMGVEQPVAIAPGDLARSALLLLAGDARFQQPLDAMHSSSGGTFSRDTEQLEVADLWTVLRTQMPGTFEDSAVEINYDLPSQAGLVRALARQFVAYAGFRKDRPEVDATYDVWFATSRKPIDPSDPSRGFGTERDNCIHRGTCRVFVPRSHKVGSLGSALWKRLATFTDDRLRLLALQTLNEQAFWQHLQQHLGQFTAADQDAVVFIHGFNVSFEQAALRAAQIGFDLQIKGAMAFYSWASRGEVGMYLADAAAVELDEAPMADFLCDMAVRSGARRVHVIAHSMGNRALLRAVHQIMQEAQRRSGVRFGQVILAAADVDVRKFHELCAAYKQLSERTTLYVSSRDAAVEASRWLHDYPRVGLMPPVTIAAGIDTVNAVNTDLSLLGHGYVAEARDVISDMHALIRHGAAPPQRFGLRRVTTPAGEPYWLIGA